MLFSSFYITKSEISRNIRNRRARDVLDSAFVISLNCRKFLVTADLCDYVNFCFGHNGEFSAPRLDVKTILQA